MFTNTFKKIYFKTFLRSTVRFIYKYDVFILFTYTHVLIYEIRYSCRMRRLEGLENQRSGGRAIWIHAAHELYVRFGEHGFVLDKMVPEGSRVLPIRAERVASDPSFPDVWNHGRREYGQNLTQLRTRISRISRNIHPRDISAIQ